ncbi:MAG TPA: hypothetical protein PKD83_09840 [Ignavibacteria bacterium]|nr:hypothetical protein [Ignavibacteria bacterium]
MLSRKKRDAKFLIFQSLYIIAIAILFYKGTDLSLVSVADVGQNDTVISKVDYNILSENKLDSTKVVVLPKPLKGEKYIKIPESQELVSKDELNAKEKRIAELEKLKTPKKTDPTPTKSDPKPVGDGVDGGSVVPK